MVLPLFVPVPATPVAPALDLTTGSAETSISAEGSKQHTVRSGETAYGIAERYGVSPAALLARNHLRTDDFIHPGQKLTVPQRSGSNSAPSRSGKAPSRSGSTRTYTVRSGDTLVGIAARHDMSLDRLRSLNDVGNGFIHPGQKLRVSGTPAKPAKRTTSRSASASTYTVRSGDTLVGIAARHDMGVTRLAKLNGVSTRTFIHPGQKLKVTGSRSGSTQSTTTSSSSTTTSTYTVRSGDTLVGIADRHDMSLERLRSLNDVGNGFIHPGQKLKVTGTKKGPIPTEKNTFAGRTYSDSIVAAADRNRSALADRSVPSRAQTKGIITRIAQQHGVDPSLALAVSYLESGWNQRQVSVANAVGVMQVIPSTGEWTSSLAGRDLDLLDTEDNVTAGVILLKVLTHQASSTDDAIAGYYQGLASVEANGMYADTKQYVANVKSLRKRM